MSFNTSSAVSAIWVSPERLGMIVVSSSGGGSARSMPNLALGMMEFYRTTMHRIRAIALLLHKIGAQAAPL
jgi:hypothetical protein